MLYKVCRPLKKINVTSWIIYLWTVCLNTPIFIIKGIWPFTVLLSWSEINGFGYTCINHCVCIKQNLFDCYTIFYKILDFAYWDENYNLVDLILNYTRMSNTSAFISHSNDFLKNTTSNVHYALLHGLNWAISLLLNGI